MKMKSEKRGKMFEKIFLFDSWNKFYGDFE